MENINGDPGVIKGGVWNKLLITLDFVKELPIWFSRGKDNNLVRKPPRGLAI